MKKILEIIRIIVYYILLFIFSGISIEGMPVGAIAMITSVYASGGILAPAIVLASLSAGLFIGTKSLIPILIYLFLFLIPVIFIRPLESIEGRNEKKKVGNYLLVAGFFSYIFFGFLSGILALIFTYLLYKTFVNIMAVVRNEEEKLVFSLEENIGVATILSVAILVVSTYFNIPLIYSSILIVGILGYSAVKKGIVESLTSYILTILIYIFLILPNLTETKVNWQMFNNELNILLILPVFVMGILATLRNFSKLVIYIAVGILNILIFTLIYTYFGNIIYYLPYLLMSIVVLVFAEDYEKRKLDRISKSHMISDEGETRLQTEKKYIINQENKNEVIQTTVFVDNEIIDMYSDKENFLNRLYKKEELFSELSLYDEIISSDNILEGIFDLIQDDGYIDRLKFNEILIENNIIIDIHSYEMEEEIRMLEILGLREIKDIVRIREEKEVLREREEKLQNDKKSELNVEETNAIEYNDTKDNNAQFRSIRDIKDNKEN